jgi:hypothetical protein
MTSTIDGPIQYLVSQILNRRCVPLVGAGISRSSTKLGEKWDGHLIWRLIDRAIEPTFAARMNRVRTSGGRFRSCKKCHDHFKGWQPYNAAAVGLLPPAGSNCILCDLRLAKQQDALAKACEAFLWEMGGNTESAFTELTSTLEISAFADLDPTPAHFYFAYLAREGLVTEAITTNYDCNLEIAYVRSWPSHVKPQTSLVHAIHNLRTFAECSGLTAQHRAGKDTPHVLKVYKINGCANELKRDGLHAQDILLTASQLQDWRKRKWAADFFRTKTRSASLVTVGFGSDEPQVVHTLQQVLEEFVTLESRSIAGSVYEAANAPIVTTFDHEPTFPQLQLVHGFAEWWAKSPIKGRDLVVGPYEFQGTDEVADENREEPPCLSADTLWSRVFSLAFAALLVDKLRDAALSESAAFTATVPHADKLLLALAADVNRITSSQYKSSNNPVHWLVSTVDDAASGPVRPALSRYLSHLRYGGRSSETYCALNDHGTFASELAFVLCLVQMLYFSPVELSRFVKTEGGRLRISLPHDASSPLPPPTFYVNASGQLYDADLKSIAMSGPLHRVQIILGASQIDGKRYSDRRIYLEENGLRMPIVLVSIDWRAIFPEALPVGTTKSVAQRLADVVKSPTKFRRRTDQNFRKHPNVYRVNTL